MTWQRPEWRGSRDHKRNCKHYNKGSICIEIDERRKTYEMVRAHNINHDMTSTSSSKVWASSSKMKHPTCETTVKYLGNAHNGRYLQVGSVEMTWWWRWMWEKRRRGEKGKKVNTRSSQIKTPLEFVPTSSKFSHRYWNSLLASVLCLPQAFNSRQTIYRAYL